MNRVKLTIVSVKSYHSSACSSMGGHRVNTSREAFACKAVVNEGMLITDLKTKPSSDDGTLGLIESNLRAARFVSVKNTRFSVPLSLFRPAPSRVLRETSREHAEVLDLATYAVWLQSVICPLRKSRKNCRRLAAHTSRAESQYRVRTGTTFFRGPVMLIELCFSNRSGDKARNVHAYRHLSTSVASRER